MSRALEGIRVIDLSHVLAAPTTTMILADLGAEVIHIEPPEGEDARQIAPFIGEPDINKSGYFISLNRNKKSMVLNLKHDKGKKILRELIKLGDIIIENFRPTTMRKLGFSWEEIQKINPRIIYASICGFGHDALPEYAEMPAYDMVAQAYSGLMSITGPCGGPPCRVGASVGDIVAGYYCAIGILAALIHREKTGRGQYYDGSMVDCLFATLENAVARYTFTGEVAEPMGSMHPVVAPFRAFESKDGWVIVPCGNERLWATFCKVIGREDLTNDPKFENNVFRVKNRDKLNAILEPIFKEKTTKEWVKLFSEAAHPVSPLNNIKDICEDPHIKYHNMVVEVDQPDLGKVKITGSALHLSETPGEVYAPAPLLGQHTEEVLREVLGYSQEEIDQLRKDRVINSQEIFYSTNA